MNAGVLASPFRVIRLLVSVGCICSCVPAHTAAEIPERSRADLLLSYRLSEDEIAPFLVATRYQLEATPQSVDECVSSGFNSALVLTHHGFATESDQVVSFKNQYVIYLREKIHDNEMRFAFLWSTIIAGAYDFVLSNEDVVRDVVSDGDWYRIQSRSLNVKYRTFVRTFSGRWPTDEEIAILQELSSKCTMAYEKAANQANERYCKLCIAAEWWSLMSHPYYVGDSQELRSIIKDWLTNPAGQKQQGNNQVDKFEGAFRDALVGHAEAHRWDKEMTENYVKIVVEVFRVYSGSGLPDDVFDDLVRDIPAFLRYCVHFNATSQEVVLRTTQWYLWFAIVQSERLTDIQTKVMDYQIDAIAKLVKKELGPVIVPLVGVDKAAEVADSQSRLLKEEFHRASTCRYYPVWKNPIDLPRWRIRLKSLQEEFDNVANTIVREVELVQKGQRAEAVGSEHRVRGLMAEVMYAFSFQDLPGESMQLPDQWILQKHAEFDGFGKWWLKVTRTQLYPAYEWKKALKPPK
jgi:hypothetical protein